MLEELIVHIGPPKTSSTAIQIAFFKSREKLTAQNFFYQPGEGEIANYRMCSFLNKTSLSDLKSLSSEKLKENLAFPKIVDNSRHMISCEDFSMIQDFEKVRAITTWSQPRKIRIVFVLREPSRWLWSAFQQLSRNNLDPTLDWNAFLKDSQRNRKLLASNMLKNWMNLNPKPELEIVNQVGIPVHQTTELFASVLGVQLDPQTISESSSMKFNESLGLGETMLMPHFNSEVAREIDVRQSYWGKIPVVFLRNSLLYQSNTARVLFELGHDLEQGKLSRMDALLDHNSANILESFTNRWWNDFFKTIDSLQYKMHGGDRSNIVNRVPVFEGYKMPIGNGFPIPNFMNYLELPRDYFSLARLYASNLGLLWKAFNNRQEIDWISS